MKKGGILAILGIAIAAAVVGLSTMDWSGTERKTPTKLTPVTISMYFGGEKAGLIADQEVKDILLQRYKITLSATKRGSIEMSTTDDTSAQHCIWPSTPVAVELARMSGKNVLSSENIFTSPIVFYSWAPVTDALVKAGLVEKRADTLYVVKSKQFVKMMLEHKKWSDIGLNLYGPIKIMSADPTKTMSGNIWAGLLATLLNNGDVPTTTDLPKLLPELGKYFDGMGYMERSSGDIFENFLKQGMGSRPMIVGYENQLVEFIMAHPEYAEVIKQKINILYPEPTVFSEHPLVSLKPEGKRLAEALKDPDIQKIAWKRYGFRTGLQGVQNDITALPVKGIPSTVDQVVPMPDANVMSAIIQSRTK